MLTWVTTAPAIGARHSRRAAIPFSATSVLVLPQRTTNRTASARCMTSLASVMPKMGGVSRTISLYLVLSLRDQLRHLFRGQHVRGIDRVAAHRDHVEIGLRRIRVQHLLEVGIAGHQLDDARCGRGLGRGDPHARVAQIQIEDHGLVARLPPMRRGSKPGWSCLRPAATRSRARPAAAGPAWRTAD